MGAATQIFSKVKEVPFIQKAIDYSKANPILVWILAGIVAFIFFIIFLSIIVSAVKTSKRKKEARRIIALAVAEENARREKEQADKAKVEAALKQAKEQEEKAKAEAAAAKAKAEAEKAKTVVKPAPATAKPATAKATPAPAKPVTAKPTAKPAATTAKPAPAKTAPAPAKKPAPAKTVDKSKAYEEDETEKQGRYTGKWVVSRLLTEVDGKRVDNEDTYFFELVASNGEKLFTSEEYTSYAGAVKGIDTHKANIAKGNFRITLSKKGYYIYKLLSGKNTLLCMGENYPTRAACEKAIDSTKRFAETAVLVDEVQEQIVKVPKEDDTPMAPLPDGLTGKWLIDSGKGADGELVYYFELYANNGEKLLTSEEYTTYVGAVNGIATHKKNIESGNFRITLTKRGDYIYKLLNGNGQLLCLGEHYKTRRLCMNAVESVKRFSANSPVFTEENTAKAQNK